ncbi:MAG TPA: translocation/assembly module TamB domain-containing protein [Burkholderiales bacterium]|nr:translocation/assembly module TamB domain-containing protein [Burkholderiales bacterium]
MRWLVRGIAVVAVLAATLAGGLWWLLHSEAAWRWALERVQSSSGGALRIEGERGTPARELRFDRLVYAAPGFRVEVRGVVLRGAGLSGAATGRIAVDSLHVDAIEVTLSDQPGQAPKRAAPPRLALPLGVSVARADVAEVTVRRPGSELAFRRLAFAYEGGPMRHRVDGLTVETPWGSAALHAEVGAAEPFAFSGAGALARADARFPLGAAIEWRGDLHGLAASLRGAAAGVAVRARADMAPLDARPLRSLEASADAVDLARLVEGLPSTALRVELRARGDRGPFLSGELSAVNARPGTIDAGRLPLARLDARFATDLESVRLSDLLARSAGGTLSGGGELTPRDARLALRAADLDLRQLHSALKRTRLDGPLDVAVSAQRQTLRGTLAQGDLSVSADVVKLGSRVDVRSLRAAANGGEVRGRLRLTLGGAMPLSGDLSFARFDPSRFGDYPEGAIDGSVAVRGRLGAPRRVDASWTIAPSRLAGLPLESAGSARLENERLSDVSAEARLGGSRISARGAFGGKEDRLAWVVDAPRLAEIEPHLAGRVHAEGSAAGRWRDPRIEFSARADALRLPGGVAVRSLAAKGAVGKDRGAPLEIELVGHDIDARGVTVGRLEARSTGSVAAHEASVLAETPGAQSFRVSARLRGGWNGADGWSGELLELRNDGRYPLRLLRPVAVRASAARVDVGRVEATLGDGRLIARESEWTPGRVSSSGEFDGLPAAWLLGPAGLAGKIESTLTLEGRWALRSDPALNGTVSVRRGGGDLVVPGTPRIAAALERLALAAVFRDGAVSAELAVASRLATLSAHAEARPEPGGDAPGPASALSFRAHADVAQLGTVAKPFLTQARVDGRIGIDVQGRGTLARPVITGAVHGEAIRIDVPPYGVYLKDGKLAAVLEGDRVRVEELSIRGGEGSLTASGALPLRGAGGGRLEWRARDLGVLDRPDMRLVLSGQGAVALEDGRVAVSGELRARSGFFDIERDRLPDLGNDVVVLGQAAPPREALKRPPVALDVRLDLGDRLTVQGLGFDGKVTGQLRVSTDKAGELRAEGKLTAKDATYLAYGQALNVDPGEVIFDGPIENPALNITAWRRNQAVEAGVQIGGTARNPRAQLVSNPSVPDGEKLSWLVLGRAPDDATKADLALLQAAAGALLPRGSSVPLTRRIARTVGLDEITLRGNSELAERVVALGKRVSDRLYVSYEQAVGATAANLVKLDYTLSRRWSVRAETGTITGLGLFYRYSWD